MLSAHDEFLLVELRKGRHFKANPGDARVLLSRYASPIEAMDATASARRLHANGLALLVADSERPGGLFLRITDDGMAYADLIIAKHRKKPLLERFAAVPRSDWIALSALVVSAIALFVGN